jgi:hypothetical protein
MILYISRKHPKNRIVIGLLLWPLLMLLLFSSFSHFGFVSVPANTIFHKPNKDLYVLGNIRESLRELAWNETLGSSMHSGDVLGKDNTKYNINKPAIVRKNEEK